MNEIVQIDDFILWWNETFPIDLWWRRKYNVSFNSVAHREANFINMAIEMREEQMIQEYITQKKKKDEDYKEYKATGVWLNRSEDKSTEEEVEEWFDNFDLAKLNKNGRREND